MKGPPIADVKEAVRSAAALIRTSRYLTAFTGAGISVESGIPPFRGAGGLWDRYDPRTLEIEFFLRHPDQAWPVIREIFYDNFGAAQRGPPGAGAPGGGGEAEGAHHPEHRQPPQHRG